MLLPTMAFRLVDDVMILVHGERTPRDDEWERYIDAVKVAVAQRVVRVLLVHSRGGGPNARQRARVVEAYRGSPVYVAVCASSALARGITTAIGWLYKAHRMHSFSISELDGAMVHLGISSALQSRVRAVIHSLEYSIVDRVSNAISGVQWNARAHSPRLPFRSDGALCSAHLGDRSSRGPQVGAERRLK